ncbi:MFS general substrate transporter [Aulographum hederae CBS 113979]|uniref:MFS general substrate transporter n=1 Tax=Aulographum hederae CBS 113979 TaxID=1176131 RepID=A0A6G1GTW4_9PEZI|nr:MFS general substrate transporter [Aulographum hederae CBS 113979]
MTTGRRKPFDEESSTTRAPEQNPRRSLRYSNYVVAPASAYTCKTLHELVSELDFKGGLSIHSLEDPRRKEFSPSPLSSDDSKGTSETLINPPDGGLSSAHEIAFITLVCSAQFLSLSALSQTVAPLLILGDAFNVHDPGHLSWFTAAFSMTLGAFILPAGRIGDMYGHKNVFIFGWVWFAALSLIAGFSYKSGYIMLVICRGLQGIGPAFTVPNAMALIGRTFPMGMKRNIVFSLLGACGPVGVATGAAITAVFAQLAWWPWSFWSLAIVCTIVACLSFFIIPSEKQERHDPTKRLLQPPTFDTWGAITGVTGLIFLNFALNQAPIVSWSTTYIPILFGVSILLLILFFYIELCISSQPLIPLRQLDPSAALALACVAAGWLSHGIWSYYFFLLLQTIRGHSALLSSAEHSPVAFVGVIAALGTGILLFKQKVSVAVVMLISMLAFFASIILLALVPAEQNYWIQSFLSMLIAPFGMNLSFPAGTILLSNAMPREHQGIAASLVATVVNYSIATGLGLAGSVNESVTVRTGDMLTGYRAAWWLGTGFAGMGVVIAAAFVVLDEVRKRHRSIEIEEK